MLNCISGTSGYKFDRYVVMCVYKYVYILVIHFRVVSKSIKVGHICLLTSQ